jgi:hypothetical protein
LRSNANCDRLRLRRPLEVGGLRSFPAFEPHAQLPCALVGGWGQGAGPLDGAFGGWELYYATADHRLLRYRSECWLEVPLHGVWARPASDAPWVCEFLLNEHEVHQWEYRRNLAVRKPLAEVGVRALGGVPILVPEIVLLYKAHELTEKDEADFRSALPNLTPSRKAWLLEALDETRPNHPWARRLRG